MDQQLRKLNRSLNALNRSNRALLRATDEVGLLEQICRIVIEDCGYAMAWIGFAENNETKAVRPAACAGFEDGYLQNLRITWADAEGEHGSTGTAIRTGKPSLCRSIRTDLKHTPWREEAIKRGYASSLSVPLIAEGKPFGAITIYSAEFDAFSEDEIHLLAELADNLSYGINALRLRRAHERRPDGDVRRSMAGKAGSRDRRAALGAGRKKSGDGCARACSQAYEYDEADAQKQCTAHGLFF